MAKRIVNEFSVEIEEKVGLYLRQNNYLNADMETKKLLIEQGLVLCVLSQLNEAIGKDKAERLAMDYSCDLPYLFFRLNAVVKNKANCFYAYADYIIHKAGEIQGQSVEWNNKTEANLVINPVSKLDSGIWQKMDQHIITDPSQIATHAFNIFKYELKPQYNKTLKLTAEGNK